MLFLECFLGAQRGPKGSPKGFKIDRKEVQKRCLEKGTKKAPKMMIFMTLECGQSVVNSCKINDFRCSVLGPFWVSFWMCFGSPNGGQKLENVVPKSQSKNISKIMCFSSIWGSHLGSQTEPERVHKGFLSHIGSPGGPRGSPGVDFGRSFDDF